MKVYHGKGSCSLGILVLLEELGVPYEIARVDLANRQQYAPDYAGLNLKSKVPMLELDDGARLTEWPAIAVYLATKFPEARLAPTEPFALARVLEAVDYIVATVHMQGFTRIARPGNFTPNEADQDAVKARGREIFDAGLSLMAASLAEGGYVAGAFSIADAALFYVEDWMVRRLEDVLPPACQDHYDLMLGRPAVQRAIERS